MTDGKPPKLRYRHVGGGYRREDVEAMFEKLLQKVRTVEANLDELRKQSTELEEELKSARAELRAYHSREARLEAAVQRAEDVLSKTGAG